MRIFPSLRRLQSDSIREHPDPLRSVVWGVAGVLAAVALLVEPARVWPEARTTFGPFATLAVLIAGGVVADRIGLFRAAARLLIPSWATPRMTFAAVLFLTALLSGLVNLDVAVVVCVPIALRVAPRVGLSASRLVLATALTANAASFLLPTSNLTTLLVLSRASLPLGAYLRQSWAAWLLVCGLTVVGLTLLLAGRREAGAATGASRRMTARALVDLPPLFAWATAIRALLGAGLILHGRFFEQLTTGIALAAAVNNLPAAAAVHVSGMAGTWAAVLAMAVGPNLLLTGSIATLISRRIARDDGVPFSPVSFSLLGLALVPAQLVAAVVGLLLTGALR
jgi:arsenical pump membrane protein